MKNILLCLLLFAPLSMAAQGFDINLHSKKIVTLDTVPSVMLVTECHKCNSKQFNGFAVIENTTLTKGWKNADSYRREDFTTKRIVKYLDNLKKSIPATMTVWDSKEK